MQLGKRVLTGIAAAASFATLAAIANPANAVKGHAVRQLAHTKKVTVRPVHRDGQPVRGYKVVRERHYTQYYTCTFHSPVSVNSGVDWCGGTADSTIACWKSTHHTVLCLRDPRVKTLVRIGYGGTFNAGRRVRNATPETVALVERGYCFIRLGGAWDTVKNHPTWLGYYGCENRKNFTAIYAPARFRDGIDRTVNPWRVHVLVERGTYPNVRQVIYTDRIRTAYYVGTAR